MRTLRKQVKRVKRVKKVKRSKKELHYLFDKLEEIENNQYFCSYYSSKSIETRPVIDILLEIGKIQGYLEPLKNELYDVYYDGVNGGMSSKHFEVLEKYIFNTQLEILEISYEELKEKLPKEFYEFLTCGNSLKDMPYHLYLTTGHWKETSTAARERADNRCQLCGATKEELHVHHNTYENRGNEKERDLIVLCKHCHELFHKNRKLV